jgi:ribonuclease VapC
MMAECVVDASAILALMQREPGADLVADAISRGVASAVNLAEVAAKLAERGHTDARVRDRVERLRLDVAELTIEDAFLAGLLRPLTREAGLSLGDRACLALAQRLGKPAVTADRRWAALDLGIKIELIR